MSNSRFSQSEDEPSPQSDAHAGPIPIEALLEDSFEAIVITTPEGQVEFWSPVAESMFGWPAHEAFGSVLAERLAPDLIDDRSSDPRGRTTTQLTRDGRRVVTLYRSRLLPDGRTIHRYLDVSSEHSARAAIEAMDERVRRIIQSMGDALLTIDFASHIRFMNPQAERLLGKAAADARYHPIAEVFPELAEGAVAEAFARALGGRERTSLDIYLASKDAYLDLDLWPTPDGVAAYMRDVTGRVRAEHEANRRREELERILSELPAVVIRFDREGRHLYANLTAELLSGIGKTNHIGKTQRELGMPEAFCETWDAARQKVLETGARYGFEFTYESTSGPRHLRSQLMPVHDPSGAVDSIVVIAWDVTEQVSSEALFRALFESSSDAHFILSNGVLIDCNQATAELLGFRHREEMLVLDQRALLPTLQPDGTPSIDRMAQIQRELDQSNDRRFEWMFRRNDGSEVLCEVHMTQVVVAGRRMTLGVAYDITGRKEAERRLRESEKRYRAIVDNASELVYSISLLGRVLYVSPSTRDLLGYDPQDVVGVSLMDLLHPEDVERFGAYRRSLMRGGGSGHMVEFRIRHRNGEYRHYSTSGAIVTASDGRPLYFVGAAQDIGEHVRLAQALRDARDAAEESSRAKTRFLAMVSHEIRTPLNGVLATADLLIDTPMTDEQQSLVRTVRSSGETLLRVLNDVLDLSRVEANRLPISLEPTDLAAAIEEVVALHRARADHRSLYLALEWSGPVDLLVMADVVRIKQIVGNLVHNALKFTHSGGVTVRAALEPNRNTAALHLTVSDTGIGIAPERLDAVFDSFTQADDGTHAMYGGTGLGLAICRLLTHAMGGTIWAESVPGQGSQFHIDLRFATADGPANTVPKVEPGQIRARVLVAEDNPVNAMVTRRHLEKIGCTVAVVHNGAEAVEAAKAVPYDLIFMDLIMPTMDGFAATRALRKSGLVDIPVIALTANASLEDHEACLEAGMNGFVAKPFTRDQLIEALSRHLARR